MAKTKKYSVADDLIFKGNLGSTNKTDIPDKKPVPEVKNKEKSETSIVIENESIKKDTDIPAKKTESNISEHKESGGKRWESTQKEKPSNPGGRPRAYTDNKVLKNGKVDDKESYYSALVKFPKSIEEPMKILAIKEKYKGGVTEYVNHVVIEDLKRRGMI